MAKRKRPGEYFARCDARGGLRALHLRPLAWGLQTRSRARQHAYYASGALTHVALPLCEAGVLTHVALPQDMSEILQERRIVWKPFAH
ncbi:MAG: hypothetical protein IIW07_01555, partial [Clostridia bacterium]|nr:hypothetical protein [Clostridia bacterium]